MGECFLNGFNYRAVSLHAVSPTRWLCFFQPASKNRRERTELKPDYFDPSSIMDDSVSIFHSISIYYYFTSFPLIPINHLIKSSAR